MCSPLAVYDFGLHDDTPYLVSELLEGETPLTPADPVGAVAIHRLIATPDRTRYAFTLERQLSDLYVVAGLE